MSSVHHEASSRDVAHERDSAGIELLPELRHELDVTQLALLREVAGRRIHERFRSIYTSVKGQPDKTIAAMVYEAGVRQGDSDKKPVGARRFWKMGTKNADSDRFSDKGRSSDSKSLLAQDLCLWGRIALALGEQPEQWLGARTWRELQRSYPQQTILRSPAHGRSEAQASSPVIDEDQLSAFRQALPTRGAYAVVTAEEFYQGAEHEHPKRDASWTWTRELALRGAFVELLPVPTSEVAIATANKAMSLCDERLAAYVRSFIPPMSAQRYAGVDSRLVIFDPTPRGRSGKPIGEPSAFIGVLGARGASEKTRVWIRLPGETTSQLVADLRRHRSLQHVPGRAGARYVLAPMARFYSAEEVRAMHVDLCVGWTVTIITGKDFLEVSTVDELRSQTCNDSRELLRRGARIRYVALAGSPAVRSLEKLKASEYVSALEPHLRKLLSFEVVRKSMQKYCPRDERLVVLKHERRGGPIVSWPVTLHRNAVIFRSAQAATSDGRDASGYVRLVNADIHGVLTLLQARDDAAGP